MVTCIPETRLPMRADPEQCGIKGQGQRSRSIFNPSRHSETETDHVRNSSESHVYCPAPQTWVWTGLVSSRLWSKMFSLLLVLSETLLHFQRQFWRQWVCPQTNSLLVAIWRISVHWSLFPAEKGDAALNISIQTHGVLISRCEVLRGLKLLFNCGIWRQEPLGDNLGRMKSCERFPCDGVSSFIRRGREIQVSKLTALPCHACTSL